MHSTSRALTLYDNSCSKSFRTSFKYKDENLKRSIYGICVLQTLKLAVKAMQHPRNFHLRISTQDCYGRMETRGILLLHNTRNDQ